MQCVVARNPLNSWDRYDSYTNAEGNFVFGANDLKLAKKLCHAGSDHRKFIRQVFILVDITAPIYWWKEYDTYKVGTVANSTSTMHKIHSKPFDLVNVISRRRSGLQISALAGWRVKMLETGIKGHQEITVTQELTAKNMGSGVMDVFATPAMLALMEKTAFTSVMPYLNEGCGSVGTKVEIDHVASSPVGMKITCDSELIGIEGRKLIFKVEAYDSKGLIGKGIHERFIVESEKFQEKTNKKL